jgi:hypothetical protein
VRISADVACLILKIASEKPTGLSLQPVAVTVLSAASGIFSSIQAELMRWSTCRQGKKCTRGVSSKMKRMDKEVGVQSGGCLED